jgi:hypothetical protein
MYFRFLFGRQSSGADILQAKVTLDLAIVILPEPWLPLANQIYKTAVPGIFVVLAVVTLFLFLTIVRLELGLLTFYSWHHLRAAGYATPAMGVRFPYQPWALGWFLVVIGITANILATLIIVRGVTFQ